MKKIIVLLLIFIIGLRIAHAQTPAPVIAELRTLLQSAKTNFQGEMGAQIGADSASKMVFYETNKKTTGAETFISKQSSGQNLYIITYNVKGENAVKLMPIVDSYVNELNDMIKSGNYKGRDYKDKNGKDVTDMTDNAGNLVLRYASNTETQNLYIYGFINK